MVNDQKTYMELALQQAEIAAREDEVPVGAVIVKDGEVVAKSYNQNRILLDPTAHAEIMVIRKACKELGNHRLDGCDLYVTLEPCAMCAAAISHARIRNLYYGASDEKFGAVENGVRFFTSSSCVHKVDYYSGIAEQDCAGILKDFFEQKR